MTKVRISGAQTVALLACLAFGKSIGVTSASIARVVIQDAWLAMLIAFVGAFAVAVPFVALARRFPGQTPTDYVPRLLGNGLGRLALLLLSLFLLGSFLLSAITIELHVNDYLMTETPTLFFVICCSLLCLYGAYLGLEVIGRLAFVGLGMNLFLGALVVVGSFDHFEMIRLRPVWEHGLTAIVRASSLAWTDSALVLVGLLFLWPRSATAPGRWMNLSWLGLLMATITIMPWPVFEIGVLGAEVTAQYLIACMQLARSAELGIYLHRYEMVMMILFGWGTLVQGMALLYFALELLRAVIPLKLARGLFMTAVVVLIIPLHYYMAIDRERLDWLHSYLWPPIALPVALGLPLLLGLVALFRKPPSSADRAM